LVLDAKKKKFLKNYMMIQAYPNLLGTKGYVVVVVVVVELYDDTSQLYNPSIDLCSSYK
jgi:hypothetical protein